MGGSGSGSSWEDDSSAGSSEVFFGPKIAVPILTTFAPQLIASWKSFDIPMERMLKDFPPRPAVRISAKAFWVLSKVARTRWRSSVSGAMVMIPRSRRPTMVSMVSAR